MSRLFFIGDTHGPVELKKLSNKNFPLARELTKEDIVCICGDGGFMWDESKETKYWDDWAEDRPFTIVSCFGNHENYNAIRALPAEEWNGGIVRKVRPHVMYLENGEFFNICGQTIFVQGGATSIDKMYRKEGKSWWPQEIPSYEEMKRGVNNLEAHHNTVDYIITHCLPNSILDRIDKWCPQHDSLTNYLEKMIVQNVNFKKWFCGHYHIDKTIDNKYYICYKNFLELLPNEEIKVINNG